MVEEAQFGKQVGHVMAGAAQHVRARHTAPGEVVEHPDGPLVPRPLVRFGQATRLGHVVVEAMEAEIPVPREHRVADLREMLEDGEIDVDGAADSVPIEHIEHRLIPKMGRHAVGSNMLFITDLFIPEEDRIGAEGEGFRILLKGLNPERILLGAEAIGLNERNGNGAEAAATAEPMAWPEAEKMAWPEPEPMAWPSSDLTPDDAAAQGPRDFQEAIDAAARLEAVAGPAAAEPVDEAASPVEAEVAAELEAEPEQVEPVAGYTGSATVSVTGRRERRAACTPARPGAPRRGCRSCGGGCTDWRPTPPPPSRPGAWGRRPTPPRTGRTTAPSARRPSRKSHTGSSCSAGAS